MKRELGSEFWDIPVSEYNNKLFPDDTRWFISGTAALEYIIDDILKTNQISSVAIPSWCCNCMITPFIRKKIKVKFYPVYKDSNTLICDYRDIKADCWVLLSFFGYTTQQNVGNPSGIIIRDLTHSVFSKIENDADYYFGSLRKWAGFYTGGYAWYKNWRSDFDIPECDPYYISMRKDAMDQKVAYIKGVSDSKAYLSLFEECEDYLDRCFPMKGFISDIEKARYLDINIIKEQRRKNARILLDAFSNWALFPDLQDDDCPLFVPILIRPDKRNALKSYLIEHNVFCPVHWPVEKEHVLDDRTKKLYQTELSIICDQRYNEDDMKHIIEIVVASGIVV